MEEPVKVIHKWLKRTPILKRAGSLTCDKDVQATCITAFPPVNLLVFPLAILLACVPACVARSACPILVTILNACLVPFEVALSLKSL